MDSAARRLGIDAVEMRRRNLIDSFPYKTATGLTIHEGSYKETLESAIAAVDIPAFRARQEEARRHGRYLGIGLATFTESTGYGTSAFAARGLEITVGFETVEVAMDPSGHVEARIGTSPHGQGLRTTLAQIIADQLGLTPDRIRITHGDTDATPYGFGTFGSRSLVLSGGASLLAAGKLRRKLLAIAGRLLETATDDIELQDGRAVVAVTDRSLSIAQIARTSYHAAQKLVDIVGRALPEPRFGGRAGGVGGNDPQVNIWPPQQGHSSISTPVRSRRRSCHRRRCGTSGGGAAASRSRQSASFAGR
jgi:carbon-monoxide dehydrogenase large subunit